MCSCSRRGKQTDARGQPLRNIGRLNLPPRTAIELPPSGGVIPFRGVYFQIQSSGRKPLQRSAGSGPHVKVSPSAGLFLSEGTGVSEYTPPAGISPSEGGISRFGILPLDIRYGTPLEGPFASPSRPWPSLLALDPSWLPLSKTLLQGQVCRKSLSTMDTGLSTLSNPITAPVLVENSLEHLSHDIPASAAESTPVVDSASHPFAFPTPPNEQPFTFTFNVPSPFDLADPFNPSQAVHDPSMTHILELSEPVNGPTPNALSVASPDVTDLLIHAYSTYCAHAHSALPYSTAITAANSSQSAMLLSVMEQSSAFPGRVHADDGTPDVCSDLAMDFLNLSPATSAGVEMRPRLLPCHLVHLLPDHLVLHIVHLLYNIPPLRAIPLYGVVLLRWVIHPSRFKLLCRDHLLRHHVPMDSHCPLAQHRATSPASSPASSPLAPAGSGTSSPPLSPVRSTPPTATTSGQLGAASSRRGQKRKQPEAELNHDEEADNGLTFIDNPKARAKAHNKRARVLVKKALALNTVSQPYLLIYCSRPESVCHKNGVASSFISDNLKRIVGPNFLQDLHKMVVDGTHNALSNAQMALQTNLEVERLRREKEEETARRIAAEARVNALQCSLNQLQLHGRVD
ncbi:hypothetical protein NUW54_g3783 [Trametes sanguinea]|uniref:Uncharacterized protein n=1 Tax=Trametes sanguinea TaxID=158606 RepID=A0ACC1Q1X0_9APHY|nr:hypothetical protein NUW54_g3783 [Trametes sanguinea]